MTKLKDCLGSCYGVVVAPGQNDLFHSVPVLEDPSCPSGNVYFVNEFTFKALKKKLAQERKV